MSRTSRPARSRPTTNKETAPVTTAPAAEKPADAPADAPATEKPAEAPAFDLAALATVVEESPEEITRTKRTGKKYENNPFRAVVAKSKESKKTLQIPAVPVDKVAEVVAFLRAAAKDAEHGLSVSHPLPLPESGTVAVRFQAKDARKNVGDKQECPICHNDVSVTEEKKLRVHGPQKSRCSGSGRDVKTETVNDAAEKPADAPADAAATDAPKES